ncbi:MAG TPA: formate dehydrogenase accessory protein FdhE [Planctomycetota bacterium]|nr:formate dehydrogenase accessory protein FdhE [Planctomycetota bacterium]
MTSVPDSTAAFERRSARAHELASGSAAAAVPLEFAAGLFEAQAALAARVEAESDVAPFAGSPREDARRFLDAARELLRFAADAGPWLLASEARSRLDESDEVAVGRLSTYFLGDTSAHEDYLSRAILRPYVEVLRELHVAPARPRRRGGCPFCGGAPWISARRDGAPMEGARRVLVCSLCGDEWSFGRILCPSCFEGDPRKLPSFSSEAHPNVRIEACEACRHYLKSIDLSQDARPIPEVDDLVSLSLDLWAGEHGLSRIEPGLAGY